MGDLPDELFKPLAASIAARAGIRICPAQRWLLSARVDARMAARSRQETLDEYVLSTLRDPRELDRLVETLRVGETRFFRHPRQLRAIRRVALPEIVARCVRENRELRCWSAGCATGEEVYTLALMLHFATRELGEANLRCEILGTDLSGAAIEHARRGIYPADRITDLPDKMALALSEVSGGFRVRDQFRQSVRFETHNLLSTEYPVRMDLILCRNVLIYFDADRRRRVLERLFESVCIHGYVALGYADRVDDAVGMDPIRTEEGILYRRVGTPSVPPPPPEVTGREPLAVAKPSARLPEIPKLRGELTGRNGQQAIHQAIRQLLDRDENILDLREVVLADEEAARELLRGLEALADRGHRLTILAESQGLRRFLRRHRVVPPALLLRTKDSR